MLSGIFCETIQRAIDTERGRVAARTEVMGWGVVVTSDGEGARRQSSRVLPAPG